MSGREAYEQAHVFGSVLDVLEAVGAVYAIWGGRAAVAYGEPRFTQDMDVGIVRVQGDRLDRRRLDLRSAQLGCYGVWQAIWQANQR